MYLPPLTKKLLWVAAAMLLLPLVLPQWLQAHLVMWPLGEMQYGTDEFGQPATIGFMPWQLLTYAFLHLDVGHFLFNMLGLWMFGAELETYWGKKRYLQFGAVCAVTAALAQLLIYMLMGSRGSTLGASGRSRIRWYCPSSIALSSRKASLLASCIRSVSPGMSVARLQPQE